MTCFHLHILFFSLQGSVPPNGDINYCKLVRTYVRHLHWSKNNKVGTFVQLRYNVEVYVRTCTYTREEGRGKGKERSTIKFKIP